MVNLLETGFSAWNVAKEVALMFRECQQKGFITLSLRRAFQAGQHCNLKGIFIGKSVFAVINHSSDNTFRYINIKYVQREVWQ